MVRLILPARTLFLNPYAMAIDTLLGRLLRALHTAIPLQVKPLCWVALGLVLASRAAVSATTGLPAVVLSSFTVLGYDVATFLGWFGLEILHFVGFYLSVLACAFFLRCWHLGRPLPGYSGDLLNIVAYPLGRFKLPTQGICICLLFALYIAFAMAFASVTTYPMAQLAPMQEQLAQYKLDNFFAFSSYTPLIRGLLLVGTTFLDAIAAIHGTIIILILMLILSMFFGSGPMTQFLFDVKTLLCGPIRTIRLGPVDLSLLVTYFALGLIYTLMVSLLFGFATLLSYVV